MESRLDYDFPSFFSSKDDIEKFMVWSFYCGASDITLQSGERVLLKLHGKNIFPSNRILVNEEVEAIIVALTRRPDSISTLMQMKALDFTYVASPNKNTVYRFRCHVVAGDDGGHTGFQITCRTIPPLPPKLETLSVEESIIKSLNITNGLILVTGPTGSGKSTLCAGMIRYMLEDPEGHRKFITFEDPIEYVYYDVKKPTSTIFQTEIHSHLLSFHLGSVGAVRRNPEVIFFGELRDSDVTKEAISLSMSGHLIMSTLHASGFVETVSRTVSFFADNNMASKTFEIINSLRITIGQQLLPKIGGGRVAIREIVIFNDDIRKELLQANNGLERLIMTAKDVLIKHGQSFTQDALRKYKEGQISKETFLSVAKTAQMADEEAITLINSTRVATIARDNSSLTSSPTDAINQLFNEINQNDEHY